jgi:7-cyano-7-deazaguanine synthase
MNDCTKSDVLLFSGGLDSLVAFHYLGRPLCVHVNLHGPYSNKEWDTVLKLKKILNLDLEAVDLGFDKQPFSKLSEDAFIPARNLLLATVGSWYGSKVCIGGIKGDNVEDNNPEAHKQMSGILSAQSRKTIEVFSPFWEMTKADIVAWYLEHVGDEELLHLSTSCYHPTEHQCGDCGSCFRKWVALKANGIEPRYLLSSRISETYLHRVRNGHYNNDISQLFSLLGEGGGAAL